MDGDDNDYDEGGTLDDSKETTGLIVMSLQYFYFNSLSEKVDGQRRSILHLLRA